MSERLGVAPNCWKVEMAGVGENHHPRSSAEITDGGCLVIRQGEWRGVSGTPERKMVYFPTVGYSQIRWLRVGACDEVHP